MTQLSDVGAAAGRILINPIRHVYALLWRFGIITTTKESDAEDAAT